MSAQYTFEKAMERLNGVQGVYELVNQQNGMKYIGCSENIGCRLRTHYRLYSIGMGENARIQKDWDKGHTFSIILVKEIKQIVDLIIEEHEHILKYNRSQIYNDIIAYEKPNITEKRENDFWDLVDIRRDEECWEYEGNINKSHNSPYGRFSVNSISYGAHRIAYLLHYGEWPIGSVCHGCDNKLCCNPLHLTKGTIGSNNRDYTYKYGYKVMGTFTEEEIKQMKQMRDEGMTYEQISRVFDNGGEYISRVLKKEMM